MMGANLVIWEDAAFEEGSERRQEMRAAVIAILLVVFAGCVTVDSPIVKVKLTPKSADVDSEYVRVHAEVGQRPTE